MSSLFDLLSPRDQKNFRVGMSVTIDRAHPWRWSWWRLCWVPGDLPKQSCTVATVAAIYRKYYG